MTVKRTAHFDRGTINLDGSKVVRTKFGYLRVPATVTRTGVLTYRLPDGRIERRLRHPDDVFDSQSLATLAGVPATEDHPFYRGGPVMLDAETTKDWQVGFTGDKAERLEGDLVGTHITITDKDAIAAIDSGELCEISCGYTADREEVPGVYNGEPYDVRQRNIVYNHVALCRPGTARAGRDMRLHLDSEAAVEVSDSVNDTTEEMNMLVKMNIGGKEVEVHKDAVAVIQGHLDSLQGQLDSVEASKRAAVADAKVAAEKAEATIDGLKSDLEKANEKLQASLDSVKPEAIQKLVKERLRIERVAERVLTKDELKNLDSMADIEIKKSVIKAERPKVDLDGKSDGYIDASFDSIEEKLEGDTDPNAKAKELGEQVANARKESTQLDSVAAKKKQDEEFCNAWKRDEQK